MYAAIAPWVDDVPPEAFVWMPAHTAVHDIGVRMMGNAQPLQQADLEANRLADLDAKHAVGEHRVPEDIRETVAEYENSITTAAGWLARSTLAASNLSGVRGETKRDSCASRRAATAAATHRATMRAQLRRDRAQPAPLRDPTSGGHQLAYSMRQWECKCCLRSGTWDRMARQRCPGPPAGRWASAAARKRLNALRARPTTQIQPPLEHRTRYTAGITWCEVCGAYAHTRARLLYAACSGPPAVRAGGGRQQQLARLRHGLHPHTGRKLGEEWPAPPARKRRRSPTPPPPKRDRASTTAAAGHRCIGPRVEAIRQRLLHRTPGADAEPDEGASDAIEPPPQRLMSRLEAMRLRIAARVAAERQPMDP